MADDDIPGLLEGLGAATELWTVTRAKPGDVIRFVQVSPAFAELLGYTQEELTQRPYWEFLPLSERQRVLGISHTVRVLPGIQKNSVRYQRRDGRLVWLDFHSVLLGGFVFSSIRDTTAEHMAKAQTRITMATLRELSAKDGLTGLYNRRFYDELLEREWHRARRNLLPLSLVSLDLDHFKRLNDTHGHEAGDHALRAAADCLRRSVRQEDLLFRVGGEELSILLPEAPNSLALETAERVLENVRSCESVPGVRMTASAGCATFPDHAVELEAFARAADAALYAAKGAGRDRALAPEGLDIQPGLKRKSQMISSA